MRITHSLVAVVLVAAPAVAGAAERPAPLPDEDGCRHYRGTAAGNDPSVELDVVLCPHADGTPGKVSGKVQWSSLLSGWNVRSVEGKFGTGTLVMRDLAIVEEKAENGYRFCTIDTYDLKESATAKLSGSYTSEACNDDARLELTPVPAPGTRPGPSSPQSVEHEAGEPPAKSEPPAEPPEDPPPPDAKRARGCGCDVSLLLLLPCLGLRRRRH